MVAPLLAVLRFDGDVLQVGQTFGTSMRCGGVQGATEEAFVAVVRDEVGWVIDGDELRLDQPGGSAL